MARARNSARPMPSRSGRATSSSSRPRAAGDLARYKRKEEAMRHRWFGAALAVAMGLAMAMPARAQGLWQIYDTLAQKRWVDLTHPFDTDTPHWRGFKPMTRQVVYDYAKDGFRAELFCHVGQWGTHVDPPAHFHQGMATADQIPVKQMLLPLVIIDLHAKVAKNPDYILSMADVRAWEAKHGHIPKGAFVAMRTDWSKRWPDQA